MSKLEINVKVDARFLKCQSIICGNKLDGTPNRFTVASEVLFIGNGLQVNVLCFRESFVEAFHDLEQPGFNLADHMCMVSVDAITALDGLDGDFIASVGRFGDTELENGMMLSNTISYEDFVGIEKAILSFLELYDIYEDELDEEWFCHCDDDVDYPVECACDSVVLDEQEEKEIDAIINDMEKEHNDRLLGMLVAVNSGDKELISKLSDAEVIFLEAVKK